MFLYMYVFRALLYGVKQFNLEPSRGVAYLQESGFLESNPESVARFLFRQERLSKKQIGGEWWRQLPRKLEISKKHYSLDYEPGL